MFWRNRQGSENINEAGHAAQIETAHGRLTVSYSSEGRIQYMAPFELNKSCSAAISAFFNSVAADPEKAAAMVNAVPAVIDGADADAGCLSRVQDFASFSLKQGLSIIETFDQNASGSVLVARVPAMGEKAAVETPRPYDSTDDSIFGQYLRGMEKLGRGGP